MIKQRTRRQCKPNNAGHEHNASGLLQRSVHKKNKNGNPNNKRELNKKVTTKNKTMQIETNNIGNEHNRNSKPVLFVKKYLVCNFSTFDTTCVNRQKQYINKYPHAYIKKPQ